MDQYLYLCLALWLISQIPVGILVGQGIRHASAIPPAGIAVA
jgi:hypothetical protein